MLRRTCALLAIAALTTGCSALAPPPAARPAAGDPGRAFAQRACAGCHAIAPSGESPNPHAPAFRDLARQRNDAELLAALGQISRNGHVEMPPIYVTPDEMKAVVAYMRSLTARAA